ncbi:hypothetical protein JCM10213_002813 [Rhodosporidiobolus nylandii]
MAAKPPTPQALPVDAPHPLPPLPTPSSTPPAFLPVLSLPVAFSLAHFHAGLSELVLQPEHSSSTILRADILADKVFDAGEGGGQREGVVDLEGYRCTRRVRRRILPSRPQFDNAMEQECLFYERSHPSSGGEDGDEQAREGLLLLLPDFEALARDSPELSKQGKLPYYHPQVRALAFRYLPASLSSSSSTSPAAAELRIDLIPLPSPSSPTPAAPAPPPELKQLNPKDRLYRTALALVTFAAKVCAGKAVGWQKRVWHDLLVGKEEVQDLYQVLKEKYKADLVPPSPHDPRITFRWLLKEWKEGTDPEKHVFEDVAIAAWLICLWRGMYADNEGRPPGGFVDVGCGNGLLVYLLASEGYPGYGIDLRARKSWAAYSPPPDLRVSSLHPPSLLSSLLCSPPLSPDLPSPAGARDTDSEGCPFPKDAFLIGNHADELTPWMPLLAFATPGDRVGYLSIPCCLHELVGRFERQSYSIPPTFLASLPSPPAADQQVTAEHPLLEPFYAPSPQERDSGGRYIAYQLYLAHLSLSCGFVAEREALRIPSTKNYGMVGRRRTWEGLGEEEARQERERVRERVRELVQAVESRGEWTARRPEGKAGEH